jgi:hypothetical protein
MLAAAVAAVEMIIEPEELEVEEIQHQVLIHHIDLVKQTLPVVELVEVVHHMLVEQVVQV